MNVSRGKTDRIKELIEQCWGFYYANAHREFETAMGNLRKLSPHHSREIYNEIDAGVTLQEETHL